LFIVDDKRRLQINKQNNEEINMFTNKYEIDAMKKINA